MKQFLLSLLLLVGTFVTGSVSAADTPAQYADKLNEFVESYTGATLKDPSNKGARRLSIKLTNLHSDLKAYSQGKLAKSKLLERLTEAATETKRYKTPTAKKLATLLADIKKASAKWPSRMKAEDKPAASGSEAAPAEAEAAPAATEDAGNQEEAAAETSGAEESAVENAAPAEEQPATQDAAAETAGMQEPVQQAGTPIWVGIAMLLIVLLAGGAIFMQHRQITELKHQVEHLSISMGTGDPTFAVNRMRDSQMEESAAALEAFRQQTEARLAGLEDLGHKTATNMAQLTERIATLETTLKVQHDKLHTLEVTSLGVGATATQSVNGNGTATVAATATATLVADAPLHTTEDMEVMVQVLRGIASTTGIPQLTDISNRLMGKYSQIVAGEQVQPTKGEVSSLIQFAYISSQLEEAVEPYLFLTSFYRKENIVAEDRMVGRMAFSEHYADNVTFDEFLSVAGNPTAEGPDFQLIRRTVENSPLLQEAVKHTVLYTRWPTILQQKDGVKTVLQKGRYIVKG